MVYLRSLIFNILFYGTTVVMAILVLPALLLPAPVIRAAAQLWGWVTVQALRVAGGKHRLSGDLQAGGQVIYAAKHQSAWETVVLALLLHTPVFVLKRELLRLPLLGWYFSKAGCIAVDRSAGMRALRKLREDAIAAASGSANHSPSDAASPAASAASTAACAWACSRATSACSSRSSSAERCCICSLAASSSATCGQERLAVSLVLLLRPHQRQGQPRCEAPIWRVGARPRGGAWSYVRHQRATDARRVARRSCR